MPISIFFVHRLIRRYKAFSYEMERLYEYFEGRKAAKIAETITGASTIRSFCWENYFLNEAYIGKNAFQAYNFLKRSATQWFQLRMATIQAIITSVHLLCCIWFKDQISPVHVVTFVNQAQKDAERIKSILNKMLEAETQM